MNRRDAIRTGLTGALLGGLPTASKSGFAQAQLPVDAARSFDFSSDLVYLSAQRSDGQNSACQAEVWFTAIDDALYVVTASDAWRAEAIRRGLTHTRVWVGDVGQWQSSDGAYLKLPQLMATGSLVEDKAVQANVLDSLGSKYRVGWLMWGPRFRNGLADGSRVMLRYSPLT